MDKIKELQKMIDESEKIVFFGGAGVSTDSGIKDFRSKDGLYNEKYKYPPEYMLSSGCFFHNTEDFYEFYKDKMNCLDVLPNVVHKYLKKLEDKNKLSGIVTQNIDGLHQKAGSKKVLELHGSIYRNYCLKCGKFYDGEEIFNSKNIPRCSCGGLIKPDVVLYGEGLDEDTVNEAIKIISEADLMIVAGTSLTVYPASGFVKLFRGKYLVIINNDETSFDNDACLVIHENLSSIFSKLK